MTPWFLSMTWPTKFYHVTQIALQKWSCTQSLVTFLWEKLLYLYEESLDQSLVVTSPWSQFYKDLTRKTNFFEGCSWFKFINLKLALLMALELYTDVANELKLKVKKFWGLIPVCGSYWGKTDTKKSWIWLGLLLVLMFLLLTILVDVNVIFPISHFFQRIFSFEIIENW